MSPEANRSDIPNDIHIELDRTNDDVYNATTGVVKVVMDMTRGVQQALSDQYVQLVKVWQSFQITNVSE